MWGEIINTSLINVSILKSYKYMIDAAPQIKVKTENI